MHRENHFLCAFVFRSLHYSPRCWLNELLYLVRIPKYGSLLVIVSVMVCVLRWLSLTLFRAAKRTCSSCPVISTAVCSKTLPRFGQFICILSQIIVTLTCFLYIRRSFHVEVRLVCRARMVCGAFHCTALRVSFMGRQLT
jgi:hypothetical protein